MKKIKVREKITLVGKPKYTTTQKVAWLREELHQAFMLSMTEKIETHKITGATEVNFTFYTPTGVEIGTASGLFGFIMNEECPVPTDTAVSGGSGISLAEGASAKLRVIRDEFHDRFEETELRQEWLDKIACRDYAEKYGFSLYQVYNFFQEEGLPELPIPNYLKAVVIPRQLNAAIKDWLVVKFKP